MHALLLHALGLARITALPATPDRPPVLRAGIRAPSPVVTSRRRRRSRAGALRQGPRVAGHSPPRLQPADLDLFGLNSCRFLPAEKRRASSRTAPVTSTCIARRRGRVRHRNDPGGYTDGVVFAGTLRSQAPGAARVRRRDRSRRRARGACGQTQRAPPSVEPPPPHACKPVAPARWAEAIAAAFERRARGWRILPRAQLYDSGGAIKALASALARSQRAGEPHVELGSSRISPSSRCRCSSVRRASRRAPCSRPLGRELCARLELQRHSLVAGGQFEYAPNNTPTRAEADSLVRGLARREARDAAEPHRRRQALRAMGAFPVPAPRSEELCPPAEPGGKISTASAR